jgi:hypothetical protein
VARVTRRFAAACLLAATMLPDAAPARAEAGVVVMRATGCTHYVVSLSSGGFALMRWFGGYDPAPGESVDGGFRSFGMTTVRGVNNGMQGSAWVEDFMLDGNGAARKMFERCSMGVR